MNLDALYLMSPVWAQNLAVASYGYLLRRRRFGPGYRSALDQLLESETRDAAGLRALQEERLSGILHHAFHHVPHYRDLAKARGLSAEEISLETLAQALPILEKEEIRADPKRFVSELPDGRTLTINTSGTTGSPLSVVCTPTSLRKNYAFFARFLGWHGISPFSRSATFAGRVLVPQRQRTPPFWRPNPGLRDLQFSSYHLSPDHLPHYANKLQSWAPEVIDTYPSSGAAVASYLNFSSLSGCIRPKVVVTSSETLLEFQREAMERAFGCPVRDQYGSAEMVAFFAECEHGTLHSMPEYGILEVIPQAGSQGVAGGDIVATGFINPAMPLLRYRTGDQAIPSDRICPCGRNFPAVERVLGRDDDVILTPEGARIGRLDPIFKGAEGITECQIVQDRLDTVTVRAVLSQGHGKESLEPVVTQLKRRLPDSMTVDTEFVASLPRTKGGKLRAVVSTVKEGRNRT